MHNLTCKEIKLQDEIIMVGATDDSRTVSLKLAGNPSAAGNVVLTVPVITSAQTMLHDGSTLNGTNLDITGMTAETTGADTDEIVLYDAGSTANRKMTFANFKTYVGGLPSGTNNQILVHNGSSFVAATMSGDATIASSGELTIAANSIEQAMIQVGAVGTTKIADDAISTSKIANDAVSTAKIANDAVSAVKIATDAVTTAKIQNDAVSAGKIATDAVTTVKIQNDAVSAAKIATDAVTTVKIQNDAVTAAKIADDAVTDDQIGDLGIIRFENTGQYFRFNMTDTSTMKLQHSTNGTLWTDAASWNVV